MQSLRSMDSRTVSVRTQDKVMIVYAPQSRIERMSQSRDIPHARASKWTSGASLRSVVGWWVTGTLPSLPSELSLDGVS